MVLGELIRAERQGAGSGQEKSGRFLHRHREMFVIKREAGRLFLAVLEQSSRPFSLPRDPHSSRGGETKETDLDKAAGFRL